MNNKNLLKTSALVLLAALGTCHSQAQEVVPGPNLPNQNSGYTYTGLQITALQNATLDSFVFKNRGLNDTIELTLTDGTVVDSTPFTGNGNVASSTITADWALTGGTTYDLISAQDENSFWVTSSFPVSDSDITVDGGYGEGAFETSYWFHFNDLTTGAAVPEPTTLALAGLGGAALLFRRRK